MVRGRFWLGGFVVLFAISAFAEPFHSYTTSLEPGEAELVTDIVVGTDEDPTPSVVISAYSTGPNDIPTLSGLYCGFGANNSDLQDDGTPFNDAEFTSETVIQPRQIWVSKHYVPLETDLDNLEGPRSFSCVISNLDYVNINATLSVKIVNSTKPSQATQTSQEVLGGIFQSCCMADKEDCDSWRNLNARMNATDKEPYTDWCSNAPERAQVVCDVEGHLTRLDLYGQSLACEFPSDYIAMLTNLEWLDISGNRVEGDLVTISTALTNVTRLRGLRLGVTQITGDLTDEDGTSPLCQLKLLESLHLQGLTTIGGTLPACFFDGTLPLLREFNLFDNAVEGPLPEFSEDLPLRYLDLSNNNITGGVPDSLAALPYLSTLVLSSNDLTGSLPNDWKSSLLQRVWLDYNQLAGLVPTDLLYGNTMYQLIINSNSFTILPDLPQRATQAGLVELSASDNQIAGSVPIAFAGFPNLETLYLQNNSLMGALPDTVGMFAKTTSISFAHNELTGTVSNEFNGSLVFNLAFCKYENGCQADFSFNKLEGPMPEFMVELMQNEYIGEIWFQGNNIDDCAFVNAVTDEKASSIGVTCNGTSSYLDNSDNKPGNNASYGGGGQDDFYAPPPPSAVVTQETSSGSSTSAGMVLGIVVGGCAVLAIAAIAFMYSRKRSGRSLEIGMPKLNLPRGRDQKFERYEDADDPENGTQLRDSNW